jgi:competence protein ComEC
VVGMLWILAPKGWPLRGMGIILLLPLLLRQPDMPQTGSARLTLLDVGQGLAAVVQTHNHTLLFDTGPSYPSGFDTGDAVVVPFLRQTGIDHVDTLVISHGNNDHAGGVASVLAQLPVTKILADGEMVVDLPNADPCRRGASWEWDGVKFRILHPASVIDAADENNHSCVLRVSVGRHAVLLTADIERDGEGELLASTEALRADILVAPHHGSKTSSSEDFLNAVQPQWVLFPVGYRNRYGFPHSEVVARYAERGVATRRTDTEGALQFELRPDGISSLGGYRRRHKRLWHGNM